MFFLSNIIIIPARLKSTRLPKKVIKLLAGKPMVQWVYEAAILSKKTNRVIIAVDSQEVGDICSKFANEVIFTDEKHKSGTDRILEIVEKEKLEGNIVNVQGDEPFIDPNLIDDLFIQLESGYEYCSVRKKIENEIEIQDVNVVKVVVNRSSEALYFSRLPIPYNMNGEFGNVEYYKHIGIYGYKADMLRKYKNFTYENLNNVESLEQLKFLENGISLKMIKTSEDIIGIDTQEDFDLALKRMNNE